MKKIAWHRVWAVILRHMYNFYHTWDRIVDAFYWPSLDIIVWGLTISSLQKQGTGTALQIAMILVGVVLWYVLWRGQYEITVNLLEELWAENFATLFSTPLTLTEWTIALCAIGFLKLSMTVTFTAGLAYLLYAVDVFRLGFTLIPFIIGLLIMGWGFGLLIA
jgi:ABC-2 type transport system permease protein